MAAIPQPKVAFFCMEYGLDETFTIYSGGLGVLAGDILKTARDLDLPFVGIGILWNEGYSDQFLDKNGFPQHCRQNYDRAHLRTPGSPSVCGFEARRLPARFGRRRLSTMSPCIS